MMKFSRISVILAIINGNIFAPVVSANEAQTGTGQEDAPWDQLAASLSSPSILTPSSIDSFVYQCVSTFQDDPTTGNELQEGSNWQLLDQPSGICMDTLSCAFEDCIFPTRILGPDLTPGPDLAGFNTDLESAAAIMAENEDTLNFPNYVVHPTSVADVVASVRFANEHGIPITVKTSGHHYSGASLRKGTLNINTRGLPAYAIDESSEAGDGPKSLVQECEEPAEGDTSYVANACRLALARGKTAIIRVGGGEVWDAVLRSVVDYNDDPANAEKAKYHALSGAAGTVSAAGGWLASGGNSASRGQRLYGLGVDQVLQMEMVLPDGQHVRFGPEEWETDPEYFYPKTTLVRGYCNENPVADELEWIWKECDIVNFNDLWMAARGGGGGTWGIVTSLIYQLHPRPIGGTRTMKFLPLTNNTDMWRNILNDAAMMRTVDETVEEFKIELYHNPSALGVSEDDSNACGCDFTTYPHFKLSKWGPGDFAAEAHCMGKKASEVWAGAWNVFVVEGRGKERLLAGGFTESQLDEIGGWAYGDEWIKRAAAVLESSDEQLLDDFFKELGAKDDLGTLDSLLVHEEYTKVNLLFSSTPGRVPDSPTPYIISNPRYFGVTTTNIPVDIVVQHRDFFVPLLADLNAAGSPWYVYGGAISNGHDQMTAIPKNRREAGLYMHLTPEYLDVILPFLFENGNKSIFPGFVGHNHNVRHGPQKDDWTKACPMSYSKEEMDELCISEQEAVWGTDLLAKLEKFKAEIDPKNIMTCATGVGFESETAKSSAKENDSTFVATTSAGHYYHGTLPHQSSLFLPLVWQL